MTQPQVIDIIINAVQLPKSTDHQHTLDLSTRIIFHEAKAPPFNDSFNYRSVVVNINFLEKRTIPEISYATHQCARFSQYPRVSHGEKLIHLVKYLKAIMTQGITLEPKVIKSLEV